MSSGADNFKLETVMSDVDDPSTYTDSQSGDSYNADNPDSDDERDAVGQRYAAAAAAAAITQVVQESVPGESLPGSGDQDANAGHAASRSVATMESILKAKEAADSARTRNIVIAAIVTTVVVLAVTLGIIFGYNKNSGSSKPNWAEDSRYEYLMLGCLLGNSQLLVC